MELVYMGLFGKLFKMVFENLIQPIVNFLAGILSKILSWVFDNIMKPMLISIVMPTVKAIASLIMDVFSTFLFDTLSMIYKITDWVLDLFYIFSGVKDVTYKGQQMTLLEMLFNSPEIQRGVMGVTAIAFVLLMLFSIISVIRSISDVGEEVNRPVVRVLQSTFNGFIRMLMIPFTCLFLISMSGVVLRSVNKGLDDIMAQDQRSESGDASGSRTTIPRIIFCLTTLDAAKNEEYNISGKNKRENISLNDELRARFYFSDYSSGGKTGGLDYTDRDEVSRYFEYKDIDYSLGFPLAILLLYILITCVVKFIERIFNVVILYVISPLFAATIPMDEGKKYEGWKELFIGELFVGFGSVVSMQIYMMLIPYLMDSRLTFGTGTAEANALIRTILLIGGAYAVKTAGTMITGFISSAAAGQERSSETNALMFTTKGVGAAAAVGKWAGRKSLKGLKALGGKLKPEPYKTSKEKAEEKKRAKEKSGKLKNGGYANSRKYNDLKQDKYLGGIFTRTYDKDGKGHFGVNMGKYFRFGMRSDGTYKANIMGFGVKYDKNGNKDSVNIPFLKFKSGDDGKMHLSKVNISNGFKFRAKEDVYKDENGNEQRKMGGMYCSDFSPLSLTRSYDSETGETRTDSWGLFGKNIYERVSPGDDEEN